MSHFSPAFCAACGGRLVQRFVAEEDRGRLVCGACGEIRYVNPLLVAGTIPVVEGRVWLLRRAIEPRYGAWTFPGTWNLERRWKKQLSVKPAKSWARR